MDDTRQLGKDEYWPHYLEPVFEVWRRQGVARRPGGERIRRIWEPDPLDICFCGGPKRFADCCKRLLDTAKRPGLGQEIHTAITTGDAARGEELARAALAQYVIWVRQHTAGTRHVAPDLHRQLLEIDGPALEAYVLRLRDALVANGHSDLFLPQLRHISGVVSVPELGVRLTALGAQWLFELGNYTGAIGELESLGDLERVNDTLALVLASKLFDFPTDKHRRFLTRAASGAFTKEERWFADFELARHLSGSGEQDEALRRVDSLIAESADTTSDPSVHANALSLRWEISQKEEDFLSAKKDAEAHPDSTHRQHLAAMLIDHGDFDEAERVLSKALEAGEPVAQLLAIDARLRAGRIDAAQELLLTVKRERVAPRLQYPYAVTCALVALTGGDDELKKLAEVRLRQLPCAGSRLANNVNELLEALDESDVLRHRPLIARVRDLLTRGR